MVKHIISNFAIIENQGKYSLVDHCTTYADNYIDIIRFQTEEARQEYINANSIVIENNDLP